MQINNSAWANRLWAIQEHSLRKMLATDSLMPQQAPPPEVEAPPYTITNGIATINVVGPICKYEDIFMLIFGGVSTIEIQNALSAANADPNVTAILLFVDSP